MRHPPYRLVFAQVPFVGKWRQLSGWLVGSA